MNKKIIAIFWALLAAVLYAINIPFSKILLQHIEPVFMASFLYFGAGAGMFVYKSCSKRAQNGERLTSKELPYTIGMIVLDIIAPICLMFGLSGTCSANASLLNNFEIVATSLIALLVFKERISGMMWSAILFITLSSILLTFEGIESFRFSYGSVYILAACACWGLENNCTRMLSSKNAAQIVVLKGIFSGLGSFFVALITKERFPSLFYMICALALGFVSYGLSIYFYVKAQNTLGAAKTSAYYAIAPFAGVLFSFMLLHEQISKTYLIALLIMVVGAALVAADTLLVKHEHLHTHVITHIYEGKVCQHIIEHEHKHCHLFRNAHAHKHRRYLEQK